MTKARVVQTCNGAGKLSSVVTKRATWDQVVDVVNTSS